MPRATGLPIACRSPTLDVATHPCAISRAQATAPESVDHVLMNPPFNDPARQNVSPDAARRRAHVGADDTLARWVDCASLRCSRRTAR